jgi:3-oxoacyl-[acyl-carrier protein] reductase
MGRLEGKAAIVTGGGRGIGRAICLAFAKEGADVVVNYASKDQPAQEVVEMIKKIGRKAVAVKGNVALKADVERIIQTAIDNFGKIDILVNNAGVSKPNMLYKMTEEQWNEVIDIQLKGPFLCIQAASKYMNKRTDQLQFSKRRDHCSDQVGCTGIGWLWGYGECGPAGICEY